MNLSRKKKKQCRRNVDKEFFIPYQPADFNKERGLEIQSFEREANRAVMNLTNDDGTTESRQPGVQKTKWDRKKKKFINIQDNEKKVKTESGQWIRASYKSDIYKKWLGKSKFVDKNLNEENKMNHKNRKKQQNEEVEEASVAQTQPRQFQQRVKQLMNKQKSLQKPNGRKYPYRSELKQPEQIVKQRGEKRKKESLHRARQAKKGGRANYKNNRNSAGKRRPNKMKTKRTK